MKRILPLIAMILLIQVPLLAQEDNSQEETPKEFVFNSNNRSGDQFIRIALGSNLPLNFPSVGKVFSEERKLSMGGFGYIGYQYFLTSMFSVGGEIGFGFNVSIGAHVYNFIPITSNFTFIPSVNQFEFPITLGIGFVTHTYAGLNYFPGLVVHPQAGVHYRINGSWSVGIDLGYLYMPQFNHLYDKTLENVHGQFFTTGLVVRHFF